METSSAALRYSGSSWLLISTGCPQILPAAVISRSGTPGLHRPKRRVVRHGFRGKRPDVAERHGSKSLRHPAIPCMDGAPDIQDRGAIDGSAAELVGSAIAELFVLVRDVVDEDIGGLRGAHGETGRSWAIQPDDWRNHGGLYETSPSPVRHGRFVRDLIAYSRLSGRTPLNLIRDDVGCAIAARKITVGLLIAHETLGMGSKISCRFSRCAMLDRWHNTVERCPSSTSAFRSDSFVTAWRR